MFQNSNGGEKSLIQKKSGKKQNSNSSGTSQPGPLFFNEPGIRHRVTDGGGQPLRGVYLGPLGAFAWCESWSKLVTQRNNISGGWMHSLFVWYQIYIYRWLLKKRQSTLQPLHIFFQASSISSCTETQPRFRGKPSNFRINPGLRRSNRRWEEQIASQKSRRRCVRKYGLHCRM